MATRSMSVAYTLPGFGDDDDEINPQQSAMLSCDDPFTPNSEEQSDYFSRAGMTPSDEYVFSDEVLLRGIAKRLTIMSSFASGLHPVPLVTVMHYLRTVKPTIRSIALTYNILANYQCDHGSQKRHDSASAHAVMIPTEVMQPTRPELLLLSAMRIACGHMEDRKTSTAWWVQKVTRNAYRDDEFRASTKDLFASVGWKLSLFSTSESVEAAMGSLSLKITSKSITKPALTIVPTPADNELLMMDPTARKLSIFDDVSPLTPRSPFELSKSRLRTSMLSADMA